MDIKDHINSPCLKMIERCNFPLLMMADSDGRHWECLWIILLTLQFGYVIHLGTIRTQLGTGKFLGYLVFVLENFM